MIDETDTQVRDTVVVKRTPKFLVFDSWMEVSFTAMKTSEEQKRSEGT